MSACGGRRRAFRAGDELFGLTLTGLVGALVSPITWPHHVFWFVPALVVLVDSGRRRDLALAGGTLAVALYGVNTFIDWGVEPDPTRSVGDFLLRNLYVLAALALVALLPARKRPDLIADPGRNWTDLASQPPEGLNWH